MAVMTKTIGLSSIRGIWGKFINAARDTYTATAVQTGKIGEVMSGEKGIWNKTLALTAGIQTLTIPRNMAIGGTVGMLGGGYAGSRSNRHPYIGGAMGALAGGALGAAGGAAIGNRAGIMNAFHGAGGSAAAGVGAAGAVDYSIPTFIRKGGKPFDPVPRKGPYPSRSPMTVKGNPNITGGPGWIMYH